MFAQELECENIGKRRSWSAGTWLAVDPRANGKGRIHQRVESSIFQIIFYYLNNKVF